MYISSAESTGVCLFLGWKSFIRTTIIVLTIFTIRVRPIPWLMRLWYDAPQNFFSLVAVKLLLSFIFQTETFVCFNLEQTANIRLKFQIYATLLAISAAFLGVTFIVYIFLPKLLNLHGKTLVCHVISLFVAYSFLSAIQFATDVKMTFCKPLGKKYLKSKRSQFTLYFLFSLHRVL